MILAIMATKPLATLFFVLYFLSGITDIFDGYIARKTNNVTKMGATLDSIADFLLIAVLMYIWIPMICIPVWMGIWIICIVLIRGSSLIIGFVKYHDLAFLHTYANKVTGFLLFCLPCIYVLLGMKITGGMLCIVATVSAIEELMINIKSKELIKDKISIFKNKV